MPAKWSAKQWGSKIPGEAVKLPEYAPVPVQPTLFKFYALLKNKSFFFTAFDMKEAKKKAAAHFASPTEEPVVHYLLLIPERAV